MSTSTQGIIVKLLQNLGSRNEVDQYLKQFSEIESNKFAIIKVGGAIVRDQLEGLVTSLTFLHRVGLFPIVVHGAGPQINKKLEDLGIDGDWVEGLRITTPEVLEVARKVMTEVNLNLVEALEKMGTRARPITSGVFECDFVDKSKLGYVGKVNKIHTENIASAIRSGQLPILTSLGETKAGQILNINADVATQSLALRVEPFKIIFLTGTGGILGHHKKVIKSISLSEEYEFFMKQKWLHSGMRLKLEEINKLLKDLPPSSSVSITSPANLARELFTHKGSGTLIRRGERIIRKKDFKGVEKNKLKEFLEGCFDKVLIKDYFEQISLDKLYYSESYRSAAILTKLTQDIPYMDKFAVTQKAQGEGLGGAIWQRIKTENKALFWRSKNENQVNAWYFRHSTGSFRGSQWTVFWYGLNDFTVIQKCIELAQKLPATFVEK